MLQIFKMSPRFAHIVVGLPLEGHFDYSIPLNLQDKIKIGQRVRISFHRDIRVGFVIGLAEQTDIPKKIKPILGILEENPCLDAPALQWTKLLSEHYGCSWGEAIETSLPTVLRKTKVVEIPWVEPTPMPKVKHETFLVHDPSLNLGWEYIHEGIHKALSHGQGVIVLVPEVYQIESVGIKLKAKFGESIAILDKKLKPKNELEQWLLVKSEKVKIVVGTRSVVFAPVRHLGAIIIFEEENEAYKQEQVPHYHARIAAQIRAFVESCHIILVSAAPSAETWWQAQQGHIQKISFSAPHVARLETIDMTNYASRKSALISFPLRNVLEKTLAEKGKVVLLMNRKGFSMLTRCNQCGYAIHCPRCDVPLTYLYSKKKMICRRCQYKMDVPKICPQCKSSYLRSMGIGIEKLESELARIFPAARMALYEKETKQIPQQADIIIGTQAVLRILPDISVDVLAILQFDALLNRLDFRSAQKAFSLLIRLRHMVKQKVIVQTFNMDNYCLKAARLLNFESFYNEELALREELRFPPFNYLIDMGLRSRSETAAWAQTNELFERLRQGQSADIEISEPQPNILSKLRDQYRFTIMMKGPSVDKILSLTKSALKDLKRKSNTIVTVGVDP